ncbi:hypothetical protein KGF57_001871 [Candida theae]|uniref:Uncharacterized protein n=1 Tax=Candida theae TaxID=1198502 RepID=A0AAD5BG32_9ASCO|nr:uncharacterized protein KGF57_001871 [Candida theae]KAI5960869.1 hypothetical protein KGF57_001871 [Candida theae]
MLSKSSTYQPLKRSIFAAAQTRRHFSNSCILTQPQYQQQSPFTEGSQANYNYSYLRHFQSRHNAPDANKSSIDINYSASMFGLNSSITTGITSNEVEESWRYADLVHPHVAEFADLF